MAKKESFRVLTILCTWAWRVLIASTNNGFSDSTDWTLKEDPELLACELILLIASAYDARPLGVIFGCGAEEFCASCAAGAELLGVGHAEGSAMLLLGGLDGCETGLPLDLVLATYAVKAGHLRLFAGCSPEQLTQATLLSAVLSFVVR
ncbi:hypothetical protein PVAND_005505 [Polypedilum vanderplanki]|uniref:Uncharacterized protein n=1 Tax=Polypedilum vanderplanki TaxID=319348 RepID=A0A9J6C141_POLVA|nr:hypothetical protein PVAND_005505 [Polypedilum vanderplanki]